MSSPRSSVQVARPAPLLRHDLPFWFLLFVGGIVLSVSTMVSSRAALLGLAMIGASLAWRLARKRKVTLVRDGGAVLGALDAAALPAGIGAIAVTVAIEERRGRKGGVSHVPVATVEHLSPRNRVDIFHGTADLRSVRAFAEALCRVGAYEMRWSSDDDPVTEVRQSGGLDEPYAARAARTPELLASQPPPDGCDVVMEERTKDVLLRWPLNARRLRLDNLGAVAPLIFGGVFVLGQRLPESELGASLPFGAVVVVASLAAVLALFGLRRELSVSRGGLEVRWRLFGGPVVWRRNIPSRLLETLYLAGPPSQVVAAGDGFSVGLCPTLLFGEDRWLRSVITRALVGPAAHGEAAVPAPALAAEGAPVTTAPLCPRCAGAALEPVGGLLEESVCGACRGRLLSPSGAARLLEEELGIRRELLREMSSVGTTRHAASCPLCRTSLSLVRLKDTDAEHCSGCGALWLDEGELSRVSQGQWQG